MPARAFSGKPRRRQTGAHIDEALVERALEEGDDMAWAKPYVDEALAEVARGEEISIEEHKARNAARLAALRP